jgi:hypothetical protein
MAVKLKLLPFVVLVCMATRVFGQDYEGDAAKARVRLGPLKINPSIALTNAGVDTNVFNSTTPQSDFTMTLTPRADMWLRVGRSWLSVMAKEDLVYYQKFESERSTNPTYAAVVHVPLTRVSFDLRTGYLDTRDRPGFEIDTRSQHTQYDFGASMEARLFGKTFAGLTATRTQVTFQRDQTFRGSDLATELDRTMTDAGFTLRHQVTPITSAIFMIDHQEDNFVYSHWRDSTSTRLSGGLRFDPNGIVSGAGQVGYRHFAPVLGTVEGYDGLIASVDMSYRARASTRVGVQMMRDLQYSYEFEQPYYLQTGLTGTVSQVVGGPFDVVGRFGAYSLGYRGQVEAAFPGADRTDSLRIFGGGIGYRFGKTRVGLDLDNQQRISDAPGRSYNGLRFGTSVKYGF